MSSIGPPPPPDEKSNLLKRAREAEDERFDAAKRQRVQEDSKIKEAKATEFKVRVLDRWDDVQLRAFVDDPHNKRYNADIWDREPRFIGTKPSAMFLWEVATTEIEERQRRQHLRDETKRFIAAVQEMPLVRDDEDASQGRFSIRLLTDSYAMGMFLRLNGWLTLTVREAFGVPEFVARADTELGAYETAHADERLQQFRNEIKGWSVMDLSPSGGRADVRGMRQLRLSPQQVLQALRDEIQRRREDEIKRFTAEMQDTQAIPLGTPGQGSPAQHTILQLSHWQALQTYLNTHGYRVLNADRAAALPVFQARVQELQRLREGLQAEDERRFLQEKQRLINSIATWPRDGTIVNVADFLRDNNYTVLNYDDAWDLPELQEWYHNYWIQDVRRMLQTPAWYDVVVTWPIAEHHLEMLEDEVDEWLTRDELRYLILEERTRRGLSSSTAATPATAAARVPGAGSSTAGIGGRYRKCRC